jgi:hypothetical protein
LREVLEPLLKEIESLNERIQEYEVRMEKIAKESYPHVELLKQVKGVGTQIALTYVLTLEDPQRFPKSREVGCFLGLKPGRRDSGESQPQMRISKEGDRYLRTMLVQGAHYILGPFGADSDLRRWGLKLAARGGANAKKRAVVAVARKLAVLLHRLWVSGEVYEPLRNSQKAMRAVAYSEELPTKQGMLGLDGIGDRRREAILVRNLSAENWKIQEERKRSIPERREMVSEQPSSTAEIR